MRAIVSAVQCKSIMSGSTAVRLSPFAMRRGSEAPTARQTRAPCRGAALSHNAELARAMCYVAGIGAFSLTLTRGGDGMRTAEPRGPSATRRTHGGSTARTVHTHHPARAGCTARLVSGRWRQLRRQRAVSCFASLSFAVPIAERLLDRSCPDSLCSRLACATASRSARRRRLHYERQQRRCFGRGETLACA